jgi:hypothetical protein
MNSQPYLPKERDMTTKEQSAVKSRQGPAAKSNWGLGLSLVMIVATVAAYLITAPVGATPGVDAAAPVSVAVDPAVQAVNDYLEAHRVEQAALKPAVQSFAAFLNANRVEAASMDPMQLGVFQYLYAHSRMDPAFSWPTVMGVPVSLAEWRQLTTTGR